MLNSYSVKVKTLFVSLLLSEDKTSEIVRVPMAYLLSLKFFEHCNDHYHSNIIFTPIELFTYVLIITLIILILSQLIIQMFCISFAVISINVAHLGVTLRRGSFSPRFPADTSTVGFFPSSFLIRRCCQNFINIK